MSDSTLGFTTPSVINFLLDAEQLTVGAQTVQRERVEVAGASALEISRVLNVAPAGTEYGLVVWPQTHPVTQSGTWNIGTLATLTGITNPVAVTGTFFQATQPVSLALLPTLATLTNLVQFNGAAISMNTGVRDAGTQRITIATNDSVPVTGTFWQATQPVSLASLPSLAAGAAIIGALTANQSVNVAQIGASALAFGQAAATASIPVVHASGIAPFDVAVSATFAALNDAVTVKVDGFMGAGFELINGTLSATLLFEGSYDGGTTWSTVPYYTPTTATPSIGVVAVTAASGTSLQRILIVPPGTSHVRARVATYTSGTSSASGATIRATNRASTTAVYATSAQSGTWTVQPGNTANTTPWLATINQGSNSATVVTADPALSAAGLTVRPVPTGFSYINITTNATTVVKSGAGVFHTLVINTVGALSNTATVYDNTAGSGAKIATIDTTLTAGELRLYDVAFATGLTIVTATGTAADITVSYK